MIQQEMKIPVGKVVVEGNLNVPSGAICIVLFAHGSGSSRFSSRNQYVAREFNKAKIGTLLFDLLTSEEEEQDTFTAEYRFNIGMLAERLVGATEHLKKDKQTKNYPFGYFGASTGAAAALIGPQNFPTTSPLLYPVEDDPTLQQNTSQESLRQPFCSSAA